MTELLYQHDSYLREFRARVVKVKDNGVILDRTAFHPRSGGVDHDVGELISGGRVYEVVEVLFDREEGGVLHKVKSVEGLEEGAEVTGRINWERRYRLMRLHTAAHIISAVMYRKYGALITGGHVGPEYAKDDFNLEEFRREIFEDVVNEANKVVREGIEVKIYWLSREEALKIPGVVKLAQRMPPSISRLRIVEIPGVDIQADGGPHVKNTAEIGEIVLLKIENRGKRRKRMYYMVKP